ncbi:MAG: hypothetical protein ABL890_00460 [Candidatus Peribacteraceae bacterium]
MENISRELVEILAVATERGEVWKRRGGVFRTNVKILDYSQELKMFVATVFPAVWSGVRDADGIYIRTKPMKGRELRGIEKISEEEALRYISDGNIHQITGAALEQLDQILRPATRDS